MINLTIIIPVFTAVRQACACVRSILESDAAKCKIILLDDGTPGGVAELESLAGQHENVHVISHLRNRGYTRNIQIGVELVATDFVCILNSDTLVPSAWGEPLIHSMEMNPYLAGVGPLSNAASYQSIPNVKSNGAFSVNQHFGRSTESRENISLLTHAMFDGELIDVPIINGFCSIFRKSAIDKIGGFDINSFPTGYGEENDLCIRLVSSGYRLAVMPSVFIYHEKSQSFGSKRKIELSKIGSNKLIDIYGKRHVPDLAKALENSIPLKSVRKMGSIIFDYLQISETLTDSLFVLHAGTCVTIDNERNVVDESPHSLPYGKIEVLDNGSITIYAPTNRDLKWLKGSEIESMSSLLMYHSTIEPVLFDLSEKSYDAMNSDHRAWLESLEFDRFYENYLQFAS